MFPTSLASWITSHISCVHLDIKTDTRFFLMHIGHCIRLDILSTFQGQPWRDTRRPIPSQASPTKSYTLVSGWAKWCSWGQGTFLEFTRMSKVLPGDLKKHLRPDLAPRPPVWLYLLIQDGRGCCSLRTRPALIITLCPTAPCPIEARLLQFLICSTVSDPRSI